MLALIKAPGTPAQRFNLPEKSRPQLAAMQKAVGGYVEVALRGRGFVVWCNEEGKIAQPEPLPINFVRPTDGDVIVGSVLITGELEPSIDGYVPTAIHEDDLPRVGSLLIAWSAGLLFRDLDLDDTKVIHAVEGSITVDGIGLVISPGMVTL